VRHSFSLAALVLLGTATPGFAQGDTLPAGARRFVGCYVVELGPWDQPLRGNEPYHTPPDTVVLDSMQIESYPGIQGNRLHPHIEALTRYRTIPARWRLVGTDSVRLSWSSGFVGVTIDLGWAAGDLTGHAEAFSDVIPVEVLPDGSHRRIPWPAAPVRLRRIACRDTAGGPPRGGVGE